MVGGGPRRRHCAAVRLRSKSPVQSRARHRIAILLLERHRERERTVDFDFTAEQKSVCRTGAAVRARSSCAGVAQARARSTLSFRCRRADGPAGLDGHRAAASRRRPGRHADGRGHRHRTGRGRMPAERRRGAVRQFRSDPHFRRIRHAGAEAALAGRAPRRAHGHEPRHDRTRCRFGADRSENQRARRRRALCRQWQQGVFNFQPGRPDLSHLCAFWSRCWRHRLGADRARCAGILHRCAICLHERRGMVRAAFCRLPRSRRERAARAGRVQEADGRL